MDEQTRAIIFQSALDLAIAKNAAESRLVIDTVDVLKRTLELYPRVLKAFEQTAPPKKSSGAWS